MKRPIRGMAYPLSHRAPIPVLTVFAAAGTNANFFQCNATRKIDSLGSTLIEIKTRIFIHDSYLHTR